MEEFDFPYTALDLTTEVNRIPNEFGYVNELGLAPIETKGSRYVRIDILDGVIHVLSAEAPGSPGQLSPADEQSGVIMEIPHFPHFENIRVDDVDTVLQVINGQINPASLDREVLRRLNKIRRNHNITLEFIRLGMLRGLIKDGKGRVLYNLFDVFDITKKTVDFALGTASTDVRKKCEEVNDHVMSNLKGETSSGVEALVSPTFFGKLIAHDKVEKFWLQAQNSAEHRQISRDRRGGNWGRLFEFGDILWREYKGSLPVKGANGAISQVANVEDDKAHGYPTGTQEMMRTFEAPVHHIDMVNQEPDTDTIYISTKPLDHGEGYEMKSQSNRLAVCKQPECLVEMVTSN